MARAAINAFATYVERGSDEQIMVEKDSMVKKLTIAVLSEIPEHAKVARFTESELLKGLDPTDETHQLKCCQLILGYQAAKGSRESRDALVRLNVVVELDNLSTVEEVKRAAPEIARSFVNPGAKIAKETHKNNMHPIWKGLEISAYMVSILMEHW